MMGPAGERDKAAGTRSTKQRATITNALRESSRFQTAQRLHLDLVRSGSDVGLSTIYRNLQALAEAGEVDVLRTDSGETMYRLCEGDMHHHHLVCRKCGYSVEVTAHEVESWADEVARIHNFEKTTHTAEIFGLCEKCS